MGLDEQPDCNFSICNDKAHYELRSLVPTPKAETEFLCWVHAIEHIRTWSEDWIQGIRDERDEDENDSQAVPT